MRIDSFFVSLIFLVISLLTLIFSNNTLLSNVAYISTLLSIALFTFDDWLDLLFIKLAKLLFSLTRNHSREKSPNTGIKNPQRLIFADHARPLKSRQRWTVSHSHGFRRSVRHRKVF